MANRQDNDKIQTNYMYKVGLPDRELNKGEKEH